jgi:predicted nucleic acid-binding protein
MALYYLDTSALVKCYAQEDGTDWMLALLKSPQVHTFTTVRLAGPELVAALFRKGRTGELPRAIVHYLVQDFKADWQLLYAILDINAQVTDLAMQLVEKHGLRGYDAVHLATATSLHSVRRAATLPDLIFLAADNDLLQAAETEGLLTENPNRYT